MTPLETESLFAQIGLMPILEGKPRLTKYRLQDAAGLPKEMRRRIRAFLGSKDFAEAKPVPALDYPKVLQLVSAAGQGQGGKLTPEQSAALFAAVPDHEMATDLGLLAERLKLAANEAIPREPLNPVTNQPSDDPDARATADFRLLWQVETDPMVVLDDLEDGSLSVEQVDALAKHFPALYAEMRQAAADAMTSLIGRRGKKWEPSPTKALLLATLRQEDRFDAELAATIQASYAAEAAAAQARIPPPSKRGKQPTPAPTPGQVAAAG